MRVYKKIEVATSFPQCLHFGQKTRVADNIEVILKHDMSTDKRWISLVLYIDGLYHYNVIFEQYSSVYFKGEDTILITELLAALNEDIDSLWQSNDRVAQLMKKVWIKRREELIEILERFLNT